GSGAFAGRTVAVTLNGKTYTGHIAGNGTWSVKVGTADLAALGDGKAYTVAASATDKAGNAASTAQSVAVDKGATVSINPVGGTNVINAAAAANGITISGQTTDSIASNLDGQAVAVAVNGKTYSGTIGNDGSWSVNVGATDL